MKGEFAGVMKNGNGNSAEEKASELENGDGVAVSIFITSESLRVVSQNLYPTALFRFPFCFFYFLVGREEKGEGDDSAPIHDFNEPRNGAFMIEFHVATSNTSGRLGNKISRQTMSTRIRPYTTVLGWQLPLLFLSFSFSSVQDFQWPATKMEPNGVSTSRHRNSPSSERFLGVFHQPFPDSDNGTTDAGDELNEDDVFWIGGFSESNHRTGTPSTTFNRDQQSPRFQRPENFGILAVLPEDERMRRLGDHSVLHRKASISPVSTSSRMIPAIPKPTQSPHEREYSQSVPSVKYHQSAPVSVPVLPRAGASKNGRNRALFEVENEDADDEMLPPHEIVERGSSRSPSTTFSVLEGVGRTLKGRDLRRVRNAVLRQTGFLD